MFTGCDQRATWKNILEFEEVLESFQGLDLPIESSDCTSMILEHVRDIRGELHELSQSERR